MSTSARAYAALVVTFSAWGTIPYVARALALPAPTITLGRVSIGAAGLWMWLAGSRYRGSARPLAITAPHRVRTAALGATLAMHWTAMFAAYDRAPPSTVIFLLFLAPLGIAAASPRALGEHVGRSVVLGLALDLAGMALVAGPTVEANPEGVALALAAAVTFAVLVVGSKPLAATYGGARTTFWQLTVASVCLLPVALPSLSGTTIEAWAGLTALGLFHTAIGTAVYLSALARVPASHVGILGYLEPVAVVAFGWLLDGEPPAPATIIGGMLVIGAGLLVVRGAVVAAGTAPEAARVPR